MSDAPNAPAEKAMLLAQLDDARAKMRVVLNKVSLKQEIYPTWTIKQVLAHIAGWDEACIASLEAFLKGEEPGTPALRGINYYNAQSVETRQPLEFEQVRREFEFTRQQLKDVIARVPDDRLHTEFVAPWGGSANTIGLIRVFIHHEAEHADEITHIIETAETPPPPTPPAQDASA